MGTRETFLALNGRQKIQFLWDYYRYTILGAGVVLFLLASLVNSYVETSNVILDVIMVDATGTYDELQGSFSEFLFGRSDAVEKDNIAIASFSIREGDNWDVYAALSTTIAAGGTDICIGPVAVLEECAKENLLLDLHNIVEITNLQKNEVYFYYDEENDKKIPYAIRVTDDPRFQSCGFETEVYCALFAYGTHSVVAEEFINYVVNE